MAPPTATAPESKDKYSKDNFPLVDLKLDALHKPTGATCIAVTSALRDSGFLMIKTPLLPQKLQQRALLAALQFLDSESDLVETHPDDPKLYAMLEGVDSVTNSSINPTFIRDLKEWYHAMRQTRDLLLQCISVGLGMDEPNFFVRLHNENEDALRLLKYPPGDEKTGNRCKEHSDYGTLTLLLNDGVGGLEAYINGKWRPVPYVKGSIVVNIGSLLSGWTRQELKATLHRVAGPASVGSSMSKNSLLDAVAVPRVSLAYFADPNGDVSSSLGENEFEVEMGVGKRMTVSDYIRYRSGRSGGKGRGRSGVAFTRTEESRLDGGIGGIFESLLDKVKSW